MDVCLDTPAGCDIIYFNENVTKGSFISIRFTLNEWKLNLQSAEFQ